MRFRPLPLLLLPAAGCFAQATGTVTGHVYCADTNMPARLASVSLLPVAAAAKDARASSPLLGSSIGGMIETGLDGSFVISGVPPGTYFVNVTEAGYLPSAMGSEDGSKAVATPDKPAPSMPEVTVAAGRMADIDIRLERGAAVSGTLRYDDGSPAPSVIVQALHKRNGKWAALTTRLVGFSFAAMPSITDDTGHFRVAGLPADEYILIAMVAHINLRPNHGSGAAGDVSLVHSTMNVYSGDTVLMSKAVPFTVVSGEEHPDTDITIPLSHLHLVSGSVVAISDGRPVRKGSVQIVETDSNDSIADADIEKDGTFRMEGVPEGSFTLKVDNASYGASGSATGSPAHSYAGLTQPLRVEGDVTGLVLSLASQSASAAGH